MNEPIEISILWWNENLMYTFFVKLSLNDRFLQTHSLNLSITKAGV